MQQFYIAAYDKGFVFIREKERKVIYEEISGTFDNICLDVANVFCCWCCRAGTN